MILVVRPTDASGALTEGVDGEADCNARMTRMVREWFNVAALALAAIAFVACLARIVRLHRTARRITWAAGHGAVLFGIFTVLGILAVTGIFDPGAR